MFRLLFQHFSLFFCFFFSVHSIAQPLYAQDALHQPVQLKAPAQRIISLAPHTTELLYSVGAGNQIVAAVEFADYPEVAKKLPRVGSHSGLNLEAILALEPDLIVYWPKGNPKAELARLRSFGIPMFASDPQDFPDIARELETLAQLTGHSTTAQPVIDEFLMRTQSLRNRYRQAKRLDVFYQVWDQPLLTQNEHSFVSKIIELCGGRNVFATLPLLSPQVSIEAVLAANPDVIMASSNGPAPYWLRAWEKYPTLKAVRHQNIVVTHADWLHRPTLRLLDAAQQVCTLLDQARKKK